MLTGLKRKKEKRKETDGSVYRVAAQLKTNKMLEIYLNFVFFLLVLCSRTVSGISLVIFTEQLGHVCPAQSAFDPKCKYNFSWLHFHFRVLENLFMIRNDLPVGVWQEALEDLFVARSGGKSQFWCFLWEFLSFFRKTISSMNFSIRSEVFWSFSDFIFAVEI